METDIINSNKSIFFLSFTITNYALTKLVRKRKVPFKGKKISSNCIDSSPMALTSIEGVNKKINGFSES